MHLERIEAQSLKEICIQRLQEAILSGQFKIGERLPSERDLAKSMGISRPVLHEAIVALDAQGLVQIEARRGVFVRDYQRDSSMALLQVLLSYEEGEFHPELFHSLIQARLLIETETAKLAAEHFSSENEKIVNDLLKKGHSASQESHRALVDYDYQFHLEIALLSQNQMYPMILNSLKGVHKNLAGKFYKLVFETEVVDEVLGLHEQLMQSIQNKDADAAQQIMRSLLKHGEKHLSKLLIE